MPLTQLSFVIMTVVALSVGQILFKMAAADYHSSAVGFIGIILNAKLIVALVVYAFATLMWLYVLKTIPLRVAYPFTSLAFFVVPVLARFLLGEHINWNTFAGAALIALGVWVSVYR